MRMFRDLPVRTKLISGSNSNSSLMGSGFENEFKRNHLSWEDKIRTKGEGDSDDPS
jgi:hypothetical protein